MKFQKNGLWKDAVDAKADLAKAEYKERTHSRIHTPAITPVRSKVIVQIKVYSQLYFHYYYYYLLKTFWSRNIFWCLSIRVSFFNTFILYFHICHIKVQIMQFFSACLIKLFFIACKCMDLSSSSP